MYAFRYDTCSDFEKHALTTNYFSESIDDLCHVEIHWDKVLEHFSPDHLDHSIISLYSHSYLRWARSCEFGRPAGRSGVC